MPSSMRIASLGLLLALSASIAVGDDEVAVAVNALLKPTEASRKALELAQQAKLIEVAPVHLPSEKAGDCNHLGWPIATMVGETIVVMHRRIPGHRAKGSGKPSENMSYGVVLASRDGGKTWSKPYDLRDCMTPKDPRSRRTGAAFAPGEVRSRQQIAVGLQDSSARDRHDSRRRRRCDQQSRRLSVGRSRQVVEALLQGASGKIRSNIQS